MAGKTARKNHGRGHSYVLDGEKAPGVTTIIGDGVPKPALVTWAAGLVGELVADGITFTDGHYIADELMERLTEISAKRERPLPAKFSRVKVAEALKYLPYAERDAAANKGTVVHRLAQQLAEGEEVAVPDELVGHVDSYLKFRDEWRPVDEIVEFTVVNRKRGYMGSGDLICELEAAPELGRCLIDLKTNRSGPFGEVALQLAAYRNGETMLDENGDEVPMPEIDTCLALWVRADGYDLYPFDAGDDVFRTFLYVREVATFATETSRTVKGDALVAPKVAVA